THYSIDSHPDTHKQRILGVLADQLADEQVNEWLDAHPEYEVKFVSQSIGKLVGKNTEDALFMSIWV
ncbi:MAG: hypothetical protein AAF823_04615, partial [Planctomycetota bacterium]